MNSVHIASVSLTLIMYVILAVAYFGWGKAAAYLLGVNGQQSCSITFSIWIGWAFTLFVLQLVHFVLPLKAYAVIPVFITGSAFAIYHIIKAYGHCTIQHSTLKSARVLAITVVVLTISGWIASRAMLSPTNYDSGLYHFQAIRWINSFPIVPGLGNLHGRLAFNQAFYPYVAALNFYPFFGHGRSLANSFLCLLTAATFIQLVIPVFKKPSLLINVHPFQYASILFTLPVLAYLALSSNGLASPSPDLTSSLLQLTMFVILVHGISDRIRGHEKRSCTPIILVILAATAIIIKLSNLAFSAVIIAFALAYAWQTSRPRIRGVALILLPAILLILIWCLRGFVLSGAPLYPSTIGYVSVEWAVPINEVINEANWVYSWARLPKTHWSNVLGSWSWFEPWLLSISKRFTDVVFPLGFFLVICIVNMTIVLFKKDTKVRIFEWSILLPLTVGLIFWFFTAPSPRFANALFLLMPISAILLFLSSIRDQVNARAFLMIVCVVFAAGNLNLLGYAFQNRLIIRQISTNGWHAIKEVPLDEKVTKSGLLVYSPKTGDQCWDAPLPCTPYFKDVLRLRKPGYIASGFTVEVNDSVKKMPNKARH